VTADADGAPGEVSRQPRAPPSWCSMVRSCRTARNDSITMLNAVLSMLVVPSVVGPTLARRFLPRMVTPAVDRRAPCNGAAPCDAP
jgi:hypothetical protein